MRSLPPQENNGLRSTEPTRVGAISRKPSGSGSRAPRVDGIELQPGGLPRRDEAVCKPQALTEVQRRGLVRDVGIRTELQEEVLGVLGGDDATETVGGFQQGDLQLRGTGAPQLRQPMRGRQARDASANDDDVFGHSRVRTCLFEQKTIGLIEVFATR